MDIAKLQAELEQIFAAQKRLDDITTKEGRDFSKEEFEEAAVLLRRCQDIVAQLAQAKHFDDVRKQADMPASEPERSEAGGYHDTQPERFRRMGDFFLAVHRAGQPGEVADRKLMTRATGQSEGVPADGGFLVQTDFSNTLMDLAFQTGKLASRCRNIPISTSANSIKIPAINETSRADSSRQGGILAYWADEAAVKTASTTALRQIQLTLNKLIGLIYCTDELLADASAMEAYIRAAFPREFGFQIDEGIINGSGVGQPLGIVNSGCLVAVAKEANQTAATVIAENIMKMYSRMLPDSVQNAVWLINQNVWPQLFQLSLAVGTGGAPLFVPAGGISDAPYGSLMGRPILPIEQCQSVGTQGDIIFADFDYYYLASKGGIQTDSSIHVKFVYDESCYRFVYRCDGQPSLASAITPFLGGTETISPFVALAARS